MDAAQKPEIDVRALRFLIGLLALALAFVTSMLAEHRIESISASYHAGGWARDYLVGSLFAIAAFLFAYNGWNKRELYLSKLAAIAALGVAFFPCGCDTQAEILPYVHYIAAGVMFLVLAFFCYSFFRRARERAHAEAIRRSYIYALCGVVILLAMALLALDPLLDYALSRRLGPRYVFWLEAAALVAFGVSWLVAGKVLPGLTAPNERYHLLDKADNRPETPAPSA